jgi:hypothetical protein
MQLLGKAGNARNHRIDVWGVPMRGMLDIVCHSGSHIYWAVAVVAVCWGCCRRESRFKYRSLPLQWADL